MDRAKGRWKKNLAFSGIDYTVYECSVCGKWIYENPSTSIFETYKENKYCRNCGAEMKDKQEKPKGKMKRIKLTATNKCRRCGSEPEIYYTFFGYWHIECPKRHIRVSTPLGIVEVVEKWNELNEGEEKNDN